ncbi:uncharacterized protein LOC143892313 isoform X2 [Tasmannia lanceolata]|uniref:uncharacterized protein LOC143892313 isoform X2 n=1 Tax=Tasmannia lanceolata TaxID=3420 RepID=UPI004064C1F8
MTFSHTDWQLQQMICFGNRSLVASDSRFGTNKLKYPVHSLLVFDSNNKAIPVAWIITPRFASGDAHKWIRALYDRIHSKDPTWKLAGFIVDDPSADVITIREVFQCSVLICFWRVRHAWHKNLMKKCLETEMCVEISRRLGQAIYSICRENCDVDLFEDFMEDFVDCSDFLDYFKAIWFPRMEMWTTALKSLPLASQETCSSMELYHHQLKLRVLNEKDPSVYQRADWLVHKLGTKVHSYYWLDEFPGKDDFARYQKDEWKSGLTLWHRASLIPDSDIVLEHKYAKVINQNNREKAHIVRNPGSEFAICECNWSRMGNLCKHVIKVSRVFREKGLALPSVSLFDYNQILMNMLHCPPHDSLIRDHAVSLAVCAKMQLKVLFDMENCRSTQFAQVPVEQPTVNEGVPSNDILVNGDKDLVDENQCMAENVSSIGNDFESRDGVQGDTTYDIGGSDSTTGILANEDGACGGVAKEIVTAEKMDVDSLSFSTSPSGSLPIEQERVDGSPPPNDMSRKGGCLIYKGHGMSMNPSSNDNALKTRDGVQDDIADDAHRTEAIEPVDHENGICGDIAKGNITGDTREGFEVRNGVHGVQGDNADDVDGSDRMTGIVANEEGGCGDVAGEISTVKKANVDSLSVWSISSGSAPVEQERVNGSPSSNDTSLKVGLTNKSHAIGKNPSFNDNALKSRDCVRDDIADDARPDEAIGVLVCENGVCGDTVDDNITGDTMDDLQTRVEVQGDTADDAHCSYSMTGIVENVDGACGDVGEEIVTVEKMDVDSLSGSVLIELERVDGVQSPNDTSWKGGEIQINKSHDMSMNPSSNDNALKSRDGVRDDISDDAHHNEAIGLLDHENGICGDIAEGNITGDTMDGFEVRNGFQGDTADDVGGSDRTDVVENVVVTGLMS